MREVEGCKGEGGERDATRRERGEGCNKEGGEKGATGRERRRVQQGGRGEGCNVEGGDHGATGSCRDGKGEMIEGWKRKEKTQGKEKGVQNRKRRMGRSAKKDKDAIL